MRMKVTPLPVEGLLYVIPLVSFGQGGEVLGQGADERPFAGEVLGAEPRLVTEQVLKQGRGECSKQQGHQKKRFHTLRVLGIEGHCTKMHSPLGRRIGLAGLSRLRGKFGFEKITWSGLDAA